VNHRPLRYFGRVSYGVYLWHLPLYAMLGWKLGILVTLAVAALSYRYVEQPFLRRKRRAAPTINQPLVDVRKSIIGNAAPASG
jgi:peptidoglycan/LPS O-acetylase OafA/YrhL